MRISYDIGFVFHPNASDEDNALALRVLLETLIALNVIYLKRHKAVGLYDSGVVYGRTQVWDSIPDLYERTYGDCKSLTAARCAELRQKGENARPVFRFMQNPQSGRRDFHILVQRGKGFEDPSRTLGMEAFHQSKGLWYFPE